jgi:DNA polymerase-3 subunit chi
MTAPAPEVWFYHLMTQPLESALPTLLERAGQRGWRVVVQVGSARRLHALDELLWTYAPDSFLPHGSARDGDPDLQKVWLTTEGDNPNGAQVRICADGASAQDAAHSGEAYERVILIFDGADDSALLAARSQWKSLKEKSFLLSYWQQTENGGWEKKA